MVEEGARRLSALMLTDVVGFTALTEHDEAGTLRMLEEHRQLVRPLLAEHRGREVKTIGDAFLVEFESALDATRCAVEIQRSLHQRNARNAGARIELRVGLHVGDVVHQAGDIYGDAVNVVSRVEPMAEPGGICVSGPVYDQVRNKIDLPFAPLGTPALKNLEFPIPLYRVELPWRVTSLGPETPWVQRPREQELLRQAIERARKGEGSAIVLLGESGVGKTRLAQEAIRSAEGHGFRLLRGRAFPGEVATPYAHWAEMVRAFLHDAPAPLVQRVGWSVAGEVAKIVPEFADRLGPMPPAPPAGDPESARARFYDGVIQFFANLAKESPLILLFDDLQWADLPSLRLFEFALRSVQNHPMLIVATCHEPEEGSDAEGSAALLPEMLRYLRKNRLLTAVPVPRLDRGAVAEMIERTFGGGEVSEEFRALVHDRTGGNPFFVEEVLRSLVEDGSIYRTETGDWERKNVSEIAIPRTVREVVKQRFNRLDEPTQATMRVAAVLGVEFPVEVLRAVSGVDEDRLIEQLERLLRAGLLQEARGSAGLESMAFSDPQLRDVLVDEVLSLRRARYHRKAGEALERLAGSRKGEYAEELARHFREGHDVGKALEYAVLAAERSARLYDFADAERYYRLALELLEDGPDPRVRATVLDGLGGTHLMLGGPGRAAAEWSTAIDLYEQVGEFRRAGGLCAELADLQRRHHEIRGSGADQIEALLERGRSLVERCPPSREQARLYEIRAAVHLMMGRTPEARAAIERAVDIARSIGDRAMEMSVGGNLYGILPVSEKDRVVAILRDGEQYFGQPGQENWNELYVLRSMLSYVCLEVVCEPAEALRCAARALEATQKQRNRDLELAARTRLAAVLLWMGDVPRVQELLRQVAEFEEAGPRTPSHRVDRLAVRLALVQDDLAAAELHLSRVERSRRSPAESLILAPDLGWLYRRRGEAGRAIELLRGVLDQPQGSSEDPRAIDAMDLIRTRAELVDALLEDSREGPLTEEVLQVALGLHRLATALAHPSGLGMDQRASGRLATRQGRHDEALADLRSAVEQFRRAENVPELARTLPLLAAAGRSAGRSEEAAEWEREGLSLQRRLRPSGPPEGRSES